MKGIDDKLCFGDRERSRLCKDYYMKRVMNEEHDWDHNVEDDAADGAVVCLCREDVLQA